MEVQTMPRRTESVQGADTCISPSSASSVRRGSGLVRRERVSVNSVSQVSICSPSSAESTSDSADAGMRFNRVPRDPLATRWRVVPPSSLCLSGATPGSSHPDSRVIRCCGAACSVPSLSSIRKILTEPWSINQALSGSSRLIGRFPAHSTDSPVRAATCAIEVGLGFETCISLT